jgi:sec-independent protein translocase protein TatB
MLDLAWSELVVIGVVALVVVGPKDLPVVLRAAGRWMGKARNLAREFQSNVDDMIREAELQELRKQVADLGTINPLASLERAIDVNPVPTPVTQEPANPQIDMTVVPEQNAPDQSPAITPENLSGETKPLA